MKHQKLPLYGHVPEDLRGLFLVDTQNRSYFVVSRSRMTLLGFIQLRLLRKSPVYRCWMYPVVGHPKVNGPIPIRPTWSVRAMLWMGKTLSGITRPLRKTLPE